MKSLDYARAFERGLEHGKFNLQTAVRGYRALAERLPAETAFSVGDAVLTEIGRMTPAELMAAFPVAKTYDGEKHECVDYFTTMQELESHGLHEAIGDSEDALTLLMEYHNWSTRMFVATLLGGVCGKLYRQQTGRDMLLDGLSAAGIPYEAYTGDGMWILHGDDSGTQVKMPNLPAWKKLLDGDNLGEP